MTSADILKELCTMCQEVHDINVRYDRSIPMCEDCETRIAEMTAAARRREVMESMTMVIPEDDEFRASQAKAEKWLDEVACTDVKMRVGTPLGPVDYKLFC